MQPREHAALAYALEMLQAGHLTIDSEGRIWRHGIRNHGKWIPVPTRRAENKGGKGYLRLTLQVDGRLRSVMAHRVVWEHTHGRIPGEIQINHKDLNKANNRPSNLELATGAENIQHSYANGRTTPWSQASEWRPGRQILSAEQKRCIKADRAAGMLLKDVASKWGTSVSHAHRVCAAR